MSGAPVAPHEQLRSKHIRTLEALQRVVDENKELKMKLSELENGGGFGNGEMKELELRCERLDFENQRLAAQLDEAGGKLTELRVTHSHTEEEAHKVKTNLLRQLNGARTEIAELQEAKIRLEAVTNELNSIKLSSRDPTKMQKRIEELTVENRGLREEVGNWHTQNASLKGQLKEMREKMELLEASVSKLRQRAEIAEHELVGMQEAASDAQNLHNDLEARFHDSQAKNEVLEQRCGSYDSTVRDQQDRIAELEDENRRLLASAAQAAPPAPISPKLSQSSEAKIEELCAELKLSRSNENDLKAALAALQEKYNNLLKNFEALKAKHKSTENDAGEDGQGFAGFVKLKRENAVLREQIKDLMQTQRRILTSAKRVAPRPGRGRRR